MGIIHVINMCMCTYLDGLVIRDMNESLTEPELKDVLADVNKIDPGWVIYERNVVENVRSFFWLTKRREFTRYILYYGFNPPEYQVINFAGGESSIHISVTKADIMNFLVGYIGGYYHGKSQLIKQVDRSTEPSLVARDSIANCSR